MTLRVTQLHFAALVLAVATVSLAGQPARAFTIETQNATNADGSSKFADPDDQVKRAGSTLFGEDGPMMRFGPMQRPFDGFQGSMNAGPPPDPYGPRSLGNND